MKSNAKSLALAGLVALCALCGGVAQAAAPYANATLQGALTPGVYGTITFGNAPPPPVIYTQPVIIQRAPAYVQRPLLYLHVPPGHAKKWSQHCARYNACNRSVYFVKVRGDDDYERRRALQPQAVYMDKNDWKEARKREKEHEKHWKKHDKHHGHHGHDD